MPLSCVSCRQRKVKCDKANPCSACHRSSVECIYPPRVRLPRGRQGGTRRRSVELARRLSRVEELLEKLGGDPAAVPASAPNLGDSPEGPAASEGSFDSQEYEPVMKADGSRYLGGDFWTSLSGEVDGLRQLLNQPSDDEGEDETNRFSTPSSQGDKRSPEAFFLFSSDAGTTDLRSFHPPSSQMRLLCDIFFSRVDPHFKVLHRPTVKACILAAAENRNLLDSGGGQEALVFAIYFAAITSMTQDECINYFGIDRQSLLVRYKCGCETALANTDFLNSMELSTLQAFVIYLMCLRVHNESRSAWTLTSLAVRIATALDLHRDGAGLSFSPFEAEMRRRLWWQIAVLDIRASEDRGSPPMIQEHSFNTKMPSNVNDEDLSPLSEERVTERRGCTDMTFSLIIHEGSSMVRRLNQMPLTSNGEHKETSSFGGQDMENMVEACCQRLESKYITHCDTTIPIFWLASVIARLISLKMWLFLQYPLQTTQRPPSRPDVTKESILTTAITILELTDMLETNESVANWTWITRMYVQWHPLAVALAELCIQTRGPVVERAWTIVGKVFEKWSDRVADNRKGTLWRPIKKLLGKAQKARLQDASWTADELLLLPETRNQNGGNTINVAAVPAPTIVGDLQQSRQLYDASSATIALGGSPAAPPPYKDLPVHSPQPIGLPLPRSTLAEIPAQTAIGLDQHHMDPVNWVDWDEFIQSTWNDADSALPSGNLQWTMQIGI
ncbi:MAG: hypothetical protein M1816_006170 [Peltula sp. TS41687]|nr:MAG: hypothetical protein M1816_006170 [Peltula sp. TS41687]